MKRSLRTAAFSALLGLGAAITVAAPSLADQSYTQCDRDGDRCWRVRCDDDGDRCRRVNDRDNYSYRYYNRYDGNNGSYHNRYNSYNDNRYGEHRRTVCDANGDNCRSVPYSDQYDGE